MAWVTPTSRATGYVVSAAVWNQDVVDNPSYLKGLAGVVYIESAYEWPHVATPANPAAGRLRIYFKNDNLLYKLDSSGLEVPVGGGGDETLVYSLGRSF